MEYNFQSGRDRSESTKKIVQYNITVSTSESNETNPEVVNVHDITDKLWYKLQNNDYNVNTFYTLILFPYSSENCTSTESNLLNLSLN